MSHENENQQKENVDLYGTLRDEDNKYSTLSILLSSIISISD